MKLVLLDVQKPQTIPDVDAGSSKPALDDTLHFLETCFLQVLIFGRKSLSLEGVSLGFDSLGI